MLEKRLGGAPTQPIRRGTGKGTTQGAVLGAVALPLDGDLSEAFSYNGDTQFASASTIKTYVLQATFEAVAAGKLRLDQEIEMSATDQVGGSGVLTSLSPGRKYTVLDIATLMIVVSDNTATNLLIEAVGVPELNESIQRHGFKNTLALGKLMMNRPKPPTGPSTSQTTPADLASYFQKLWRDELLPKELGEIARGIYRRQQYTYLTRELDFDRYQKEPQFCIASKTGALEGVRNDAGIFEPLTKSAGRPLIVAIMTRGCPDLRYNPNNLGEKVVSAAGKALYLALR